MTAAHPEASRQAVVKAALMLLERMGLTPADLAAVSQYRPKVPTFAEYVPIVSAAASDSGRPRLVPGTSSASPGVVPISSPAHLHDASPVEATLRLGVRRAPHGRSPDLAAALGIAAATAVGCSSTAATASIHCGISSRSALAFRPYPPGGDASALPFAPSSGPAWSARTCASCPSPSWSPPWNARAGSRLRAAAS